MLHPNTILQKMIPLSQPLEMRPLADVIALFDQFNCDKRLWDGPCCELNLTRSLIEGIVEYCDDLLKIFCATYNKDFDPSARALWVLPCSAVWFKLQDYFVCHLIVGDLLMDYPLRGIEIEPRLVALWLPMTKKYNAGIWKADGQICHEGCWHNVTLMVMAYDVNLEAGTAKRIGIMVHITSDDPKRSATSRMIGIVDGNDVVARDINVNPGPLSTIYPPILVDFKRKSFKENCDKLDLPEVLSWYDSLEYPLAEGEMERLWDMLGLDEQDREDLHQQLLERDAGQMASDKTISLARVWHPKFAVMMRQGDPAPMWDIVEESKAAGRVARKVLGNKPQLDLPITETLLSNVMQLWRYLAGDDEQWQRLDKEGPQFTKKLRALTISAD